MEKPLVAGPTQVYWPMENIETAKKTGVISTPLNRANLTQKEKDALDLQHLLLCNTYEQRDASGRFLTTTQYLSGHVITTRSANGVTKMSFDGTCTSQPVITNPRNASEDASETESPPAQGSGNPFVDPPELDP
jgi:hypothetical protein